MRRIRTAGRWYYRHSKLSGGTKKTKRTMIIKSFADAAKWLRNHPLISTAIGIVGVGGLGMVLHKSGIKMPSAQKNILTKYLKKSTPVNEDKQLEDKMVEYILRELIIMHRVKKSGNTPTEEDIKHLIPIYNNKIGDRVRDRVREKLDEYFKKETQKELEKLDEYYKKEIQKELINKLSYFFTRKQAESIVEWYEMEKKKDTGVTMQ